MARTTGQFLFSLVAPHVDCEVLEIGGSRGYSSIWLGAGVRHFGGRVLSLEADPPRWRLGAGTSQDAGLEETVELIDGDAFETLPRSRTSSTSSSSTRRRTTTSASSSWPAAKVEPGGLFVADNVLSHADPLADYSKARQADPTLESVTVPLDRGLELSVVLSEIE